METFADHGITVPQRGGAHRYTQCPQCSSSRKHKNQRIPCLSINLDKGVWNCHHCGWKGGLKMNNMPGPVYTPPRPITYNPPAIHPEALAYLKERGLTDEVIERNRITSSPRKFGKDVCQAIHFPYLKDGVVVNVKYRTRDKRFSQEAGAEKILYGYDDIGEVTIITEGEFDKLSIEVAGFESVVSVPDGAPSVEAENYTSKFDFLANCEAKLNTVKTFILALDNDKPGQKLEAELSRRLGRYRCKRVTWPEGCKDANDTLLKHGVVTLINCIYDAQDYPIKGLVKVSDSALEQYYDEGIGPGLNPGWKSFGQLYTVKPGQLTVITGAPNSGKSEFLDAILVNLANKHDWRFLMFSPENAPTQAHITKLVEKKAGKTASKHYLTRMDKAEYLEDAKWVREHFEFVDPDGDDHSLDYVLETAKTLLLRNGINGLVIDPWNQLEHERPAHLTETEYIGKCLTRILKFSRQNEIHTFIVAHPAKMRKEKDPITGQLAYPPATLYDIAGSANWFNKTDMGLSVFRSPEDGKPVTVFVQKVRFSRTDGKKGSQDFMYNPHIGTYTEVGGANAAH